MKKLLLLLSLVVPLVALAGPGEGISGSPSRLQAPVGVGVNPSPWLGSSVDVGSYAGMASDTLNSYFLSNAYKRADGNFVYKAAGRIAGFTISKAGGAITFGVAPTSTAGATVASLTTAMTISNTPSINIAAPLTSTKSCASGYTRLTANYCRMTNVGSYVLAPSVAAGCTAVAAPAADAKAVDVALSVIVQAANVAGNDGRGTLEAWSDSGCSTSFQFSNLGYGYEFSAVSGVHTFAASTQKDTILLASTGGSFYLKTVILTSATASYQIRGYYD